MENTHCRIYLKNGLLTCFKIHGMIQNSSMLFLPTVYTAAEQKLAVLQIRAPIIQVNERLVEQQMDCFGYTVDVVIV